MSRRPSLQSSALYGDFLLLRGCRWRRKPSLVAIQPKHAVSAGGEGDHMDRMGRVAAAIDDLTMTMTRMMLTILLPA
ncbi:hypothetical protein NL676_000225 [Syzygium grande]|nr:hypothetical protein NL676_000225 [Syzygium grande]